ncbi:MAG: molecular chaperone TorD family protein [Deltaproteobacteria bacterium]|jgi:putative dimethyl sulfoxide reductase chaperone|nr:molecular chaperone TorD family protein [Deltaproteobacteria bacterium]
MNTIKSKDRIQLQKNCIRLLTDIYWGPTVDICRDMVNKTYLSPFEQLNKLPGIDISGFIVALNQSFSNYSSADQLFYELEGIYVRTFINALDGIQTPLYHSCYLAETTSNKGLLMGASAIEMVKRYEEAGLSISEDIKEPPDHISLELEYLYFLQNGLESSEGKAFQTEINEYVSDFMLPWIIVFLDRIKSSNSELIFLQMTSILVAVLKNISRMDTK